MNKTVLIMAGGTGGHIMPGIALAELFIQKGWQVHWLGQKNSMEERLVQDRFKMHFVNFGPLRHKGIVKKLSLPFRLLGAIKQCRQIFKEVSPNLVLGMGGYVSVPGGIWARLTGTLLAIHEQNTVAGLSNRLLAQMATIAFAGFDIALGKRSKWVGNPVRQSLLDHTLDPARYDERAGPIRILVLGGSQGAQAINDIMLSAFDDIPEIERPLIRHQTGNAHYDQVCHAYQIKGHAAQCVAFIEDMKEAYAWADIVICRSGALTLAEIAVMGLPSCLIPLPTAVDDHQMINAKKLGETSAAFVIDQNHLHQKTLQKLAYIPRKQLKNMAICAKSFAKPNATHDIIETCETLLKEKHTSP